MEVLIVLLTIIFISFISTQIKYSIKKNNDNQIFVDDIINSQEILVLTKGVIRYGYSGSGHHFILDEVVEIFLCTDYLILLPKPNGNYSAYNSLVLFDNLPNKKFLKKFSYSGKVLSHRVTEEKCIFFSTIGKNRTFPFLSSEIQYKVEIEDLDDYFIEKLDEVFN